MAMPEALTTLAHAPAGPARFKQGMRCLVGSVNVIALQGLEGSLFGVTATAVCSLSAEPPSLIACVNLKSRLAEALRPGAGFSVNVLATDQQQVAQAFGGQTGVAGVARFAFGDWYRSEHDIPLLAGARASFECRVAQISDFGSHRAAFGLVTDVHLGDGTTGSLVFGDGRYGAVA